MPQARSQETRARILDVAARAFARNGYDATGVAEICRQAGVSKGAFYYHFASKQALFMALLDHWMVQLQAALQALAADAPTAPDQLARMAQMVGVIFESESARLPMFLEFWLQAGRDPTVQQAVLAPYRKYHRFFAALIQAGVAEGSLAPVNADAAAQTIVALGSGLLLQGLLDPEGADWGAVAQQSVEILLQGLRRR